MKKRFKHIYLELTNICDRRCSFCPEVKREKMFMPFEDAQKFLVQSAEFAEAIYFHIQGEPLLHPDFEKITTFAANLGLTLKLTTNASHLAEHAQYLLAGHFYQINFSIQSLNGVSENERMRVWNDIADFTEKALDICPEMYINYRWWQNTPPDLDFISRRLNIPQEKFIPSNGRNHTRITGRLYSSFDSEFVWPSDSIERSGGLNGSCQGLISHCGILCDGRVVPCCLDCEAELELGDLHSSSLNEILSSPQAVRIAENFRRKRRIMPLCRKCGFACRFDT